MSDLVLPLAFGLETGKAVPHWGMREITWDKFVRFLASPASSKSGAISYIPGEIVPGPGGKCKCSEYLHRTKETVVSRWAITLDADHCAEAGDPTGFNLIEQLNLMGMLAVVHPTWSHTMEAARLRVVVPMDRAVKPLEYSAISRLLMEMLGAEKFDHTCEQASRLFYGPSTPNKDDYWITASGDCLMDADLWLDLAGGPDVPQVIEPPVRARKGSNVTAHEVNILRGLCKKLAECQEGNRDSLLLWCLKVVKEQGIDPELAGELLVGAGIHAGLDEAVCWEKVERILGE